MIFTQPEKGFCSLFSHLPAFVDFKVTSIRRYADERPIAGTTVVPEELHQWEVVGTRHSTAGEKARMIREVTTGL